MPVDVDNFSLWETAKWVVLHGHTAKVQDPIHIAHKLFYLTMIFVGFYVVNIPIKRYYDYEDPLLKDKDDTLDGVSAEATLRRLKYKKKTANWQSLHC